MCKELLLDEDENEKNKSSEHYFYYGVTKYEIKINYNVNLHKKRHLTSVPSTPSLWVKPVLLTEVPKDQEPSSPVSPEKKSRIISTPQGGSIKLKKMSIEDRERWFEAFKKPHERSQPMISSQLAGCNRKVFLGVNNKVPVLSSRYVVGHYSRETSTYFNNAYSKYYAPRPEEIIEFLCRHLQYPKKTDKDGYVKVKCPTCRPKKDNYFSMMINTNNGTFDCLSCSEKGTWHDYLQMLNKTESYRITGSKKNPFEESNTEFTEVSNYKNELSNHSEVIAHILDKFKITYDTLRHYEVGMARYINNNPTVPNIPQSWLKGPEDQKYGELCITFPRTVPSFKDFKDYTELKTSIARIKACSVNRDFELVAYDPPSFRAGLFGYHLASLETEAVILAGNEFDAMAAYQDTKIPAFCLPTESSQLHLQILPLLQRFSKIYVWLDDDVIGQDMSEMFVKKLGIERCLIVNTRCGNLDGPLNASQALIAGRDLNQILSNSKPLPHEQIINFDHIKDGVYREIINPDQVRGVMSNDIPALNKTLKGHRPGEMTIFSGGTGTGKTTVLSQLSLDYCISGVSTLWGSFEIPNVRLAKKMLQQFSEKDLSQHPEEFSEWAAKFQQFFGSTEIDTVIEAMNHATFAYDVRHIIIDNLQFMTSDLCRFNDRWEYHDRTISKFRSFATEKNVHITLVVHPRKDSRDLLDINSIFGSAKVSQEADNIVILQKIARDEGEFRYLDIRKNRFDGTLASIPIEFVPETLKVIFVD
ncbi:14360_t:CDS:2 [Entrophospora sp. SA101]|nr:14360_t:CDS:2 [Entrophospora sp. SA101]